MSGAIEATANVVPVPTPPPATEHKSAGVERSSAAAAEHKTPVQDAAAVRADKVSMAEEEHSSAAGQETGKNPTKLDVWA
jgi:hypothetical protein